MTDPTIPEIVARLRELHAKANPGPLDLVRFDHDDGDISWQSQQANPPHEVLTNVLASDLPQARAAVELIVEAINALPAILDALDHVGDAVAHSPDGGNIVDQFRAAGQRLRAQGVDTAAMAAEYQESRLELYRWRPITQPPSAEVHAWCGGWYLFREPLYDPRPQRIRSRDTWVLFDKGTLTEYLPIPPSDERRG